MSTESSTDTFNLLKQSLITFLSQLSSSLIAMISNDIITNYVKYKTQTFNQTLYRAVFLYSKQEVKALSYSFNKMKKKPISPQKKQQQIKQFLLAQNDGHSFNYDDYRGGSSGKKKSSSAQKKRINHGKNKSINYSHRSILNNSSITINNFMIRQEKYSKIQSKSKERIFKDNEEEYNLICTFNPKINKNPNIKNYYTQSKTSAHIRLYNDSIKRMNRKEEIEKEISNKLNSKKPLDKAKIDQLYEDYKIRKLNKKKLTYQLDEERGYTFTPEISRRNVLSGSSSIVQLKNGQNANNYIIKEEEPVNRSVCVNNNNKKDFAFIYDYIRGKKNKE